MEKYLIYGDYKKCFIEKGRYWDGGREGLTLVDKDRGPVLSITINVPDIYFSDEFSAIKNYSENEGVLEWLIKNNLIKRVIKTVPYNFITIPIVEFNREELDQYIVERSDSDDE